MRAYIVAAVLLSAVLGRVASAADPVPAPTSDAEDKAQTARIEPAVAKGVQFLLSKQRADGAICEGGNATAMTALSIIGMCAVGTLPSHTGKDGAAVRKALAYVLQDGRMDQYGYYGHDGSRMYGHGIITLMLAEVLGMGVDQTQDRLVRERLDKALGLILWSMERKAAGNPQYGGWRYEPNSTDSDLSVSVWQLLALRAAKNAGVNVPKKAIDAAVAYLKRSYQSPRDAQGRATNLKSGCAYQPGGGPTYAMASAGLLALQVCGDYDSAEVQGSADWLKDLTLDPNTGFFFYGTYYYAQGMYQRGGEYAERAKRNVVNVLCQHQQPDGGWQGRDGNESGAGRVYATSMALLSLSVQYHYLPIYQR